MAGIKGESAAWWAGGGLLTVSAALLSCVFWYYRLEVMLLALFPMLLGTYLIVYGCKHELARQKASSSDSESNESLVKALTLVQKIVEARNQMLSNDAGVEARNAQRRFFEIVNDLLAWLQDKGRRAPGSGPTS